MIGHPLLEAVNVAQRVDLDAMIPREDFAVIDETSTATDLIQNFPIIHLDKDAPVLKLLRKPNFQRETNHWNPDQLVTFIESFLDNEVIPSLIFWKSQRYIFVIDGGHRISAIRAWIEDDYGDKHLSRAFYKKDIPKKQIEVAERTRALVKKRVGSFTDIKNLLEVPGQDAKAQNRAQVLFTRGLHLQWIGPTTNAAAAETSFFKINSQGTPLDETESLLIRFRLKPVAVAARAILRAGSGHRYWSAFSPENAKEIESITYQMYEDVFKPEMDEPVKTLELPLGGSVSPVDALALLVEFLSIAGTRNQGRKTIDQYNDDATGEGTISVLRNAHEVLNRISGKSKGSLGLHPAVYFYNDRVKYSRFMFLAMVSVVQEKLRDNNSTWFKKFTKSRSALEEFLLENKTLLGTLIGNLSRGQRVSRMKDFLEDFVAAFDKNGKALSAEQMITSFGMSGRIVDARLVQQSSVITDETKSAAYVAAAIKTALICPICKGLVEPSKSVSFDHIERVRDGGTGDISNVQLTHPYCNTGYKN